MNRRPEQTLPERKLREAVAWHERLATSDAGEAAFTEFAAWLESNPENRVAFDRVEDFDSFLGDALSLDRQANTSGPLRFRKRAPRKPPVYMWMAGAAAIAAILLIVFAVGINSPSTIRYATGVGQSRTVLLPDGSRIEMNTATSIAVQTEPEERRVTLERGEAIFRIHRQEDRPFIVTAGDRAVRDLGTVFDVLRNAGQVAVAVAEGQVTVTPTDGAEPTILRSGDRLRHTEGTNSSELDKIDPQLVTAWQSGYLVYRDAPLAEVVDDLNRYFRIPVVVEPGTASFQRFSGVLHIRDESAAIGQLTAFLPIIAVRSSDGRIRLRAANRKP